MLLGIDEGRGKNSRWNGEETDARRIIILPKRYILEMLNFYILKKIGELYFCLISYNFFINFFSIIFTSLT